MLTIRKEQMEEFEKASLRQFEEEMAVHLHKYFPEECKTLDKDGLYEIIRHAIKKAGEYNIELRRDIFVFTDIMFAFGQNFDNAPDLPWAKEILNAAEFENDPSDKVEALYEEAMKHIDFAQGIQVEEQEQKND
jgi:hypothetical protein